MSRLPVNHAVVEAIALMSEPHPELKRRPLRVTPGYERAEDLADRRLSRSGRGETGSRRIGSPHGTGGPADRLDGAIDDHAAPPDGGLGAP